MTTGLLKYKDGNKRTQIAPVFLMLGTLMVGYSFLLLLGAVPTSKEAVMRVPSYTSLAPLEGQVKSYRHNNLNLRPEMVCTDEQRDKINQQLDLESGNVNVAGCNDPDWLDSFFEEEEDIGSESFLGISVGCNKGTDAVQIARLGMSDAKFDVSVWTQFIGDIITVCPAREQGQVKFPKRKGEIHCIEPMLNNVVLINNASRHLDLSSEEFVVTQAAISARVS
jgi:hypothetical protein